MPVQLVNVSSVDSFLAWLNCRLHKLLKWNMIHTPVPVRLLIPPIRQCTGKEKKVLQ